MLLLSINVPPYDAADANRAIWNAVRRQPTCQLAALLTANNFVEGSDIIGKFFGIEAEELEENVVSAYLMCGKRIDAVGTVQTSWLFSNTILVKIDGGSDGAEACYVSEEDFSEPISGRSAASLHPAVFRAIAEAADEFGASWRDEEGYPDWFDLISRKTDEIIEITDLITRVCVGGFDELLDLAGYTRSTFSAEFMVPLRTVSNWCTAADSFKLYSRLAFADQLGIFGSGRRLQYSKYGEKKRDAGLNELFADLLIKEANRIRYDGIKQN